jgi:SAM-dependent methyltransferase
MKHMSHVDGLDSPAAAKESKENNKDSSLAGLFERLEPDLRSKWAWDNYKSTVEALSGGFGLKRLIEIGGGRDPLFTPQEAEALGVELTVNDISAEELRHAPDAFAKACFDVSADLSAAGLQPAQYDLAFSRMVFEHVKDGRRAWANLGALLAPGGVAIAFVPTLYALPYLANMVIPESVSQRIVKMLYKHRTDDEDPKFPAHYDWCYGSEARMAPMLKAAGFREALVVPFYFHDYFERIPLVREADNLINALASRRDWRALTSYAYIVGRK